MKISRRHSLSGERRSWAMHKAESLLEIVTEHQCMADARTPLGQGVCVWVCVCVCECVCKHKELSQQSLWLWKARPVTEFWEHCCMGAWRRATAPRKYCHGGKFLATWAWPEVDRGCSGLPECLVKGPFWHSLNFQQGNGIVTTS